MQLSGETLENIPFWDHWWFAAISAAVILGASFQAGALILSGLSISMLYFSVVMSAVSIPWFLLLGAQVSLPLFSWLLLWAGTEWLFLRGAVGVAYLVLVLMLWTHLRLWRKSSRIARPQESLVMLLFIAVCAFNALPELYGPLVRTDSSGPNTQIAPFVQGYFSQVSIIFWGVSGAVFFYFVRSIHWAQRRLAPLIVSVIVLSLIVPSAIRFQLDSAFYVPYISFPMFFGALFLSICLGGMFLFGICAMHTQRTQKALCILAFGALAPLFLFVYRPLWFPFSQTCQLVKDFFADLTYSQIMFGLPLDRIPIVERILSTGLRPWSQPYLSGLLTLFLTHGLLTVLSLIALILALMSPKLWRSPASLGLQLAALAALGYSLFSPGLSNPVTLSLCLAVLALSAGPESNTPALPKPSRIDTWITSFLAAIVLSVLVYFSALAAISAFRVHQGPVRSVPAAPLRVTPELLVLFVVAEDILFLQHSGFDFHQINRSLQANLAARKYVRGASTVTMQLAKMLYLGNEKTVTRKLQQALLTMVLEWRYSKLEILRQYLLSIDLGYGQRGIIEAANYYFKKDPASLTRQEILQLVLTVPNPKLYNPSLGPPSGERALRASEIDARALRFEPDFSRSLAAQKEQDPASKLIF